jgi:hypothetical protein
MILFSKHKNKIKIKVFFILHHLIFLKSDFLFHDVVLVVVVSIHILSFSDYCCTLYRFSFFNDADDDDDDDFMSTTKR